MTTQIYYYPTHLKYLPTVPLYREDLLFYLSGVEKENLILLDDKLFESKKPCKFVTLEEVQNRKQSCENLRTQLQEFII